MNAGGLIFVVIGLFTLCGAGFDWDWFMNSRKAQVFVTILGRNGARVFYGLLGTFIVVLGVLMSLGVLQGRR